RSPDEGPPPAAPTWSPFLRRRGLESRLKSELGLQPGRHLLPRVPVAAEAMAVVKKGLHVEGVEILLLVLEGEFVSDVGKVEVEPVALGRRVDPVEITDALRVDEGMDGVARDADRPSLNP